ncbi:right-handed parallel beta-helix repeat-containing protein [Bacteroidota bacterium]
MVSNKGTIFKKGPVTYFFVYITLILVGVFLFDGSLATTYHVAKGGLDSNVGSSSSPYLTINKAAQLANPGDTIIVHEGIYREWVQPPRGGSSEDMRITYMAAKGEQVIIKGSERITEWQNRGNGVWKTDISDAFFGNYHPYTTTIAGRYTDDYIKGGIWCHLGEVFLDDMRYDEKQTLQGVQDTLYSWYTDHSGTTTTIYANFGSGNPVTQLAEISVRESIFGNPDMSTGINHITVDGFTMTQSAEEWSPAYLRTPLVSHAVIFVSGTHWIIQNCTVTYAKMRGISIDGPDVVANHIVRNNVINRCGVSGISGCFDHGSVISGNWIQNIGERTYWGVEHAGIKIHLCKNMIVSGNIIYKVTVQHWGMGIWLDYAKDGNRITGNVIIKTNDEWLRPENPTGVNLFDNNIGLDCGEAMLEDGSVYVHNLAFNAPIAYRKSYVGTGEGKNGRVYNNIFIDKSIGDFDLQKNNISDYNVFMGDAIKTDSDLHSVMDPTNPDLKYTVDEDARTVTLEFSLDPRAVELVVPVISSTYISVLNDGSSIKNPDGSPLTIDRDIYQYCKETEPRIGPFQNIIDGKETLVLRPNSDFIWDRSCIKLHDEQ